MYTETTLCYIEHDGAYLMLHRVKKKNDLNEGKWVGVGGHLEPGETPEMCVRREVLEETGLTLTSLRLRGTVDFISDRWVSEVMYLYTADSFTGSLIDCNEGVLKWVPKEEIPTLPQWAIKLSSRRAGKTVRSFISASSITATVSSPPRFFRG